MFVEIKNLSNRPVLMRLNSGQSVHLSPGATSAEVADAEISNNAKITKLQSRHLIVLSPLKNKGPKMTGLKKVRTKKTK